MSKIVFLFSNHGSIGVLTPFSAAATAWCAERLPEDTRRWGTGYAIEHRYIAEILRDIRSVRAHGER